MTLKTLCVRLEENLRQWFTAYLEQNSYGDTVSQRFRIFILRLRELESQGITLANPKKAILEKMRSQYRQTLPMYSASTICVKQLNLKDMTLQQRHATCKLCEARDPLAYEACQSLRKEQEEGKPT